MTARLLPLLLAAGCLRGPAAAELIVDQIVSTTGHRPEDPLYIELGRGSFDIIWPHMSYGAQAPEPLRAFSERIAGCGQAPRDRLEFRLHAVRGAWPWTVEIREATPGAEACLEGLLAQLPLEVDGPPAARYIAARTTVSALRAPRPEDVDPLECMLSYHPSWPPNTTASIGQQLAVAELAHAVTCPGDPPLTQLTLRYAFGALVAVETAPGIPCVEERARAALGRVADLGFGPPKMGPSAPKTLEGWDEVTCTLQIPLRAR